MISYLVLEVHQAIQIKHTLENLGALCVTYWPPFGFHLHGFFLICR